MQRVFVPSEPNIGNNRLYTVICPVSYTCDIVEFVVSATCTSVIEGLNPRLMIGIWCCDGDDDYEEHNNFVDSRYAHLSNTLPYRIWSAIKDKRYVYCIDDIPGTHEITLTVMRNAQRMVIQRTNDFGSFIHLFDTIPSKYKFLYSYINAKVDVEVKFPGFPLVTRGSFTNG